MVDRMYASSTAFVDLVAEGNTAASHSVKDQEEIGVDYDTVPGEHSPQKAKADGTFDQDSQLDTPGVHKDRMGQARTYTEDSYWEALDAGGEQHLDDQK